MIGIQLVLAILAGLLMWLLVLAVLFLLGTGIGSWLSGFLYFMQDYTTGFLKVRERVAATNREAIWGLSQHNPMGEFADFSLEIGKTESTSYSHTLSLPGDFRPTHMYVVGASGSGKSSLLKNLLLQDIEHGMGLCVIDPHGDLVYDLIPFLGRRAEQTVLLDLADTEHILPYNPLQRREGVLVAEQVAKLLLAFKRIWADSWGARMEDIMRHTLALLIEQDFTLAEFERVLVDGDFRELLTTTTNIEQTREYFLGRYNTWNSKERALFIESSLNKVSAFMADPRIGTRMSIPISAFGIKDIMDGGGILLVNLAKGRLAGNADLFGALLMADIEMSFLSRKPNERTPFALYVDEFQNIATDSFGTVLTEARKFGLCLTMAHQSLKQLDDKLVSLILGNAQTQIYFRVARQDAERLAKESANIVKDLREQDERLMQEPERKFSLSEMWEVAFHSLARLPQRNAYVMVKGTMEYPEKIQTLDNPLSRPVQFKYSDFYVPLTRLERLCVERKRVIEEGLKKMSEKPVGEAKQKPEPPDDLSFLDAQA